MVEHVLAKDETGVRFSLPAPYSKKETACPSPFYCIMVRGRESAFMHFRGESKTGAISERFTATMARSGRSHTIYVETLLARANTYIDVSCADSPYPHSQNEPPLKGGSSRFELCG